MFELVKTNSEYISWLSKTSRSFRSSQIKAASSVNSEMLKFYWNLGRDLHFISDGYGYGSSFYETISRDLQNELPDVKSFSATNLRYMRQFYELFPVVENIEESDTTIHADRDRDILPQLVGDFKHEIFMIPWGHIRTIIDKCKNDESKALFYVKETLVNNWSRAVLLNFLGTDLYERQGKAVTNFKAILPPENSELAQAITKDPYNFDFLTLTKTYTEKELKDALMDNITKFLLELGNGFSFLGREYRIEIGETENFIDLLFYNTRLHCYVVVEVKITEFDPAFAGQLGTYVVAVNHQLKTEIDSPTLGLLICRDKDNIKAQYSLEASSQPLGVSAYELSNLIPDDFKGSLPTIEEIEAELNE